MLLALVLSQPTLRGAQAPLLIVAGALVLAVSDHALYCPFFAFYWDKSTLKNTTVSIYFASEL
jgi:hypothetical protein